MHTTHDLSREDCARLLSAGVAGRVALGTPTGPHIVPVNYAVGRRVDPAPHHGYSLLGTYGRDAQLCFEVDQFDYELKRGWSVVVRGRATFVDDQDELAEIARSWQPRPWADGPAQPRRPDPVDRGDRAPARRRLGPVAAPARTPPWPASGTLTCG